MTDAPPPIDTPPPAAPPPATPPAAGSAASRSPWLFVGAIVAALLVGFIVARGVYGPMPAADGNSSIAATPSGAPAPVPTLGSAPTNDPLAPPPAAPVPNAGAPAMPSNDLMAQARAFLARPEQAYAVQRMLRTRAAGTPGNCPQLSFTPRDVLVSLAPTPVFDAGGRLAQGMVRQRFVGVGCPGMSSRYNIWVIASGAGAPIDTIAGYMGDTRADPTLLRDATPLAISAAQRALPGCGGFSVIDTRVPPGTAEYGTAPWREYWLLLGCGKMVQTTLYFTPNLVRGGTDLMVPSTAAKVITL